MPFDFDAAVHAPFRMQPGLRRLAPGTRQLTPTCLGSAALVEKLAVLSAHASQALCRVDGFDPAPALQRLARQAAAEHPAHWRVDGPVHWCAPALGWALRGESVEALDDRGTNDRAANHARAAIGACLRALPGPWRPAALLALAFAEDFAILDGRRATIPWIAACLPSRWAPEDKVGRHFTEVHAPVADNRTLLAAAEHLTRLVAGTDRWERFVWTVTRHPALGQHPARASAAPWPLRVDADGNADVDALRSASTDADAALDDLAAHAFFRTEHQTFIPLPEEAQAVFTILVEVRPLADAVAVPGRASRLQAAIASMSPAVLAYRGLTEVRERLLQWLARRAAAE